MDITICRGRDGVTVRLAGRFDADGIAQHRALLQSLAADADCDVYLDLSQVASLDSAAIGIIAFIFKRLAGNRRRLMLVGPRGQPKRLLELLRLDRVIAVREAAPADPVPIADIPAEARRRTGEAMAPGLLDAARAPSR
jgi:anti-anti-sigma factor